MQRDDIGAGKQVVLLHVLGNSASGLRRAASGSQDRHTQRPGDAPGLLTYAPEADYAERLAVKLDERIVPETPVLRVLPAPLMHGLRVVRNVMAYLEQHRYGKLRDGGGAVGRDVADRYAASLCVFIVDDVIARRSDGDIFKAGAGVDDRVAYRDLVCDDDLRLAYAADDLRLIVRAAVIDRIFAELTEPVPAQVAGVFRISVKNNCFHCQFLRFVFLQYN